MLRRHRSWVIGPTFAGLVIAVVVAYFMPDVYVSSAAMQIRPSAISSTLMPTAISNQMSQRLQELNLEILGRDNLINLIQSPKLNLYPKERQRYSVEDVVEDTFRRHVHIVPYESTGANGAQAFHIVFEYPDRYVAKALVGELVAQYQAKNVTFQQQNTNAATTLFDDMVQHAKEKMEQKQNELANFISENQGRLPDNFQTNAMEVNTRQQAIGNLTQQIASEQQRQSILESDLNNNKSTQTLAEQNQYQTVNNTNNTVRNTNLSQIDQSINSKLTECAALERRYTPEYPDVQSCHDQLKVLQDKKATEEVEPALAPAGTTSRTVENTETKRQLDQLRREEGTIRSRLAASVQQVDLWKRQMENQIKDLNEVRERINASPQVVQRFNQLSSELQMAKDEYTSASSKNETTRNQKDMEEHGAGEILEILEQPITPEKPTSPIRPALVGIGAVIGLVVGIALAGAKEVKNTSLKNLKDVRAYTNLPVLSSIPLLENALLVRRKRRLAWLAWSSAAIVGAILMSGAMYYHFVIVGQA